MSVLLIIPPVSKLLPTFLKENVSQYNALFSLMLMDLKYLIQSIRSIYSLLINNEVNIKFNLKNIKAI